MVVDQHGNQIKSEAQNTTLPPQKSILNMWSKFFGLIIGTATLMTAIYGIFTQYDKIVQYFNPASPLQISYARLYGALQVPALMNGIKNDTDDHSGYSRTKRIIFINDYTKTFKAWKEAPLSEGVFALGPLGDEIRQEFIRYKRSPTDLLNPLYTLGKLNSGLNDNDYKFLERWTFKMTDEEIADVVNRATIGRGIHYEDGNPIGIIEDIQIHFENSFNQVGYLFLLLELSDPEQKLSKLKLDYQIANRHHKIGSLTQTVDKILPEGAAISETMTMSFFTPNPNKPILMPLAVFIGDQNGFPKQFASKVIVPKEMSLKVGTRNLRINIDPPGLEAAGRIGLPIGWYHQ